MSEKDWRELYAAAVLEVDPGLLGMRIEAAEAAILRRLETIKEEPGSLDERQEMSDASAALRVLKSEGRNWSSNEN